MCCYPFYLQKFSVAAGNDPGPASFIASVANSIRTHGMGQIFVFWLLGDAKETSVAVH